MKDIPVVNSFSGGVYSPNLAGRVDFPKYRLGCLRLENFIVLPQGPATFRPGFRYRATAGIPNKKVILVPFVFSRTQAYVLEFGHQYMRVFKDQGQVIDGGSPYEIGTPYSEDDLSELHYCQSADVLFLVHPNHAPRKLTRTGHTAWSLTAMTFGSALDPPTGLAINMTGAGSGTDHTYVVTTIAPDTLEESEPCASATHDGPASLTTATTMVLTWDAVAGAEEYWVYKDVNGVYSYLGKAGAGASPQYVDNGSRTPDSNTTPPSHPTFFNATDGYPRCVTFYQQRLCFASTNQKPQGLWFSRTGAYKNFSSSRPVRDDDAIILVADADQNNVIQWVFPGRSLLFGTVGGEWTLAGPSSGPMTPTSYMFDQGTYHGSENLMPAVVGNAILFMEFGGRRVREMMYSLDSDGYVCPDLTILAEHLFRSGKIVSWAYQRTPWSILWAVRDDGMLLGLTYQREHEVVAWHTHQTHGFFESVAVIPGEDRHELWAVVRRAVNGLETRYIELMDGPYEGTAGERAIDGFFMDAGLTYGPVAANITGATQADPVVITAVGHPFSNGDKVRIYNVQGMTELNGNAYLAANVTADSFELAGLDGMGFSGYLAGGTAVKCVTNISGMDHLEGETVTILADGAVHPNQTVVSGSIDLNHSAEVVHIGLAYEGLLEPMPLQPNTPQGGSMGRIKRVSHISLRLDRSLGGAVGPDEDHLENLLYRTDSVPMGQAPGLFTGETPRIAVDGGFSTESRVMVAQRQPLPLTVTAIIPRVDTTGD
jgi:hypothetical protein